MATQKNSVTILNGASTSEAIVVPGGLRLAQVITPAAWTAAKICFDVSYDGSTFLPLWDITGEVASATLPTTGLVLTLSPSAFDGITYLKVLSGTHASAVTQGADRLITLNFIPI